LTQVPPMLALSFGVTDLHWLARLQSFGLFAVPTGLYSLALWRVRHEPALLTTTMAAIAIVFMSTSYFIIGEYNTAYACAILSAVTLCTIGRPCVRDGVLLAFTAWLSARSYEHMVYLGLLLGIMTVTVLVRVTSGDRLALRIASRRAGQIQPDWHHLPLSAECSAFKYRH
jgi:hypothetical protein